VILSHGYTVAMDKPTTTCDACGKRYEFTSHKDRCPVCCPKSAPGDAFEDYELVDEVYDDDARHQGG